MGTHEEWCVTWVTPDAVRVLFSLSRHISTLTLAHRERERKGERGREKSSEKKREREMRVCIDIWSCILVAHLYHVGTSDLPPLFSGFPLLTRPFFPRSILAWFIARPITYHSKWRDFEHRCDRLRSPPRGVALHAGMSKTDFFQLDEKCRIPLARESIEDVSRFSGSVPRERTIDLLIHATHLRSLRKL